VPWAASFGASRSTATPRVRASRRPAGHQSSPLHAGAECTAAVSGVTGGLTRPSAGNSRFSFQAPHEHSYIWPFYRPQRPTSAWSLRSHDGMTLVANEFISVAVPTTTGAAHLIQFHRLLPPSCGRILVNPVHVDGIGCHLLSAVAMAPNERRARMGGLRQAVL